MATNRARCLESIEETGLAAPLVPTTLTLTETKPASLPMSGVAPRDLSVDLIKGFACALMLLAHIHFPDAIWVSRATLATVLFFASTGMNFFTITERHPGDDLRLAGNGLFLIFGGFADNYVQGTMGMADVFQSAGMAMLAMLLLRRLLPHYWTWLFPVPFLLHLLNQHAYWKIHDGGLGSFFLAPGLFPLLPWLSFYLLGAHLKRYPSQRMRLLLAGGAALLLTAHATLWPFAFHKFWMNPEYFLIGVIGLVLVSTGLRQWVAARWVQHRRWATLPQVRRWGANSLVFYVLHTFVLHALSPWIQRPLVLFVAGLSSTAALLYPALALQKLVERCGSPRMPLAFAALLSSAVVFAEFNLLHGYMARSWTSYGLTLSFVIAYPAWRQWTRQWPKLASPAPLPEAQPEAA